MTSLFTRLRSFFQDTDRYSGINELYRLESEPTRQVDLIEQAIVNNFTQQLEWKIGYFMERLQQENQLRNVITYMLVFKDLVSIGPEAAANIFLNYKLRLESSEVLKFFTSYLTKVAFNRELYGECLQTYNNLQPQISCLRAYKALNLLEEVFNIVEVVLSLEHRELYHRLSICLVSDAVLYFIYVKQTILRHAGAGSRSNFTASFGIDAATPQSEEEDPDQLLNVVEEFHRMSAQFRRILFDFKIQNSYYKLEEQKTVNQLKRSLRSRSFVEKCSSVLTERDANRQISNTGTQFSFGACKSERPAPEH